MLLMLLMLLMLTWSHARTSPSSSRVKGAQQILVHRLGPGVIDSAGFPDGWAFGVRVERRRLGRCQRGRFLKHLRSSGRVEPYWWVHMLRGSLLGIVTGSGLVHAVLWLRMRCRRRRPCIRGHVRLLVNMVLVRG